MLGDRRPGWTLEVKAEKADKQKKPARRGPEHQGEKSWWAVAAISYTQAGLVLRVPSVWNRKAARTLRSDSQMPPKPAPRAIFLAPPLCPQLGPVAGLPSPSCTCRMAEPLVQPSALQFQD